MHILPRIHQHAHPTVNDVTVPARQYTRRHLVFYGGDLLTATHLCDEPVRDALRAAIAQTRINWPITIDAWVLLPDHLHCIWTLPTGDADFAIRWNLIKHRTSQALKEVYFTTGLMTASKSSRRELTFWQRRYWEHVTSGILSGMLTTFITIRSSMAIAQRLQVGRIQASTAMCGTDCIQPPGAVAGQSVYRTASATNRRMHQYGKNVAHDETMRTLHNE